MSSIFSSNTILTAIPPSLSSWILKASRLVPIIIRSRGNAYARIFLAFLASRLMLALIGLLTLTSFGDPFPTGPDHSVSWESFQHIYTRWDSHWYLSIINEGYNSTDPEPMAQPDATNFAFFPYYPLLVIAAQRIWGLSAITAGILVSNLAFFTSLILIFEYAKAVGSSNQTGVASAVLLCFVPQSFIFSAIYTESTFLLMLVAAMYALRKQRYLISGLCAALLSSTRANGVFFIVFAGCWLLRHHGLRPFLYPWRYSELVMAIIMAPLGLVTFWWFCFFSTGDAFAQVSTVLHGWRWQTDWPWVNLAAHLTSSSISTQFWAISSLLIFVLSFTLFRLKLYEEFLLCFSIMLLYWSSALPHSLLRYSIVLFPVFIGIAAVLENRLFLFQLLLSLCGLLNGFLMTAWVCERWISI